MNETEHLSSDDLFCALSEHIQELRKRLSISLIGLVSAIVLTLFFSGKIMAFLCLPIGGMEQLKAIEITENVSAVFHVSTLAGFILAFPLIAYELLAFIIPALRPNEKNQLFRFLPLVVLFFLIGVVFAFTVLLPTALPFLTSFMGIETEIRPANYISFTTGLLFWVGILFEMPMVIYVMTRLGVFSASFLLKHWRQAVVLCSILAMLITPTVDPVNMLLLMVPLIGLYFISILFAKIAENKK